MMSRLGMSVETVAVNDTGMNLERRTESLGVPYILLLIYLVLEYARPANPMSVPMAISIILFLHWLTQSEKVGAPQITCFLLLLAVIALMGPFARNNYAVFMGFRNMGAMLLCFCVPMISLLCSNKKISLFLHVLIGVYVYVALFAILHHGYGPGGSIGDENDVALALNVGLPFAFVSILAARTFLSKFVFMAAFAIIAAGVIATFSRGGFLGFLAVLAYCFILSPKKKQAVVILLILAIGLAMLAPADYWAEMYTIQDDVENVDKSNELRLEYWAIARRMFADNVIFGVGIGNFKFSIPLYEPEDQDQRVGRSYAGSAAHSVYYTVLAELGLAGAVIYLSIIMFNIRDLRDVIRADHWAREQGATTDSPSHALLLEIHDARLYSHGAVAGLIGFLVSGTFLSVFEYPHFWILTAVVVSLKATTVRALQAAQREFGDSQRLQRKHVTPSPATIALSPR